MKFISRKLERWIDFSDTRRASVIYGARQVGKTTLVEHLIGNRSYEWLTGDRASHIERLSDESACELLLTKEVLFIDEAQRVPSMGLVLKRLVDKKSKTKIIVTGSSSLELSGKLTDSAAGRFEHVTLWPFSLAELAQDVGVSATLDSFESRLLYGSYPVVITEPEKAERRLNDLLDSLIFKDIFEINGVRKPTKLMQLVKFLAQSVGSEVSFEGIAKRLAMSIPVVMRYIDLLEQSFIIFRIDSFSRNVATELRKGKKIYFCDVGIRNAVLGDFRPLCLRNDTGALFENLVATELKKAHEVRQDGTKLYFWRTAQQQEIDFVEETKGALRALECKMTSKNVRASKTFTKAYPEAEFCLVTPKNILRIVSGRNGSICES